MTTRLVNVDQAKAWDGAEGEAWAQHEERYEAATAAHTLHLMRAAAIRPDDRVLDIGCGCGGSTLQAGVLASSGRTLGVDLSERMLDRGRRRAADQGLDHVEFVQADAQVHPFDPAAFDVVISRFGAMFFADPISAFTNIGRAVRPAGRLVLLAWREIGINPWITQIRGALAAGRELPQPPANAPGPFGLADFAYARGVLDQSGWGEVQLTDVAEPVYLGKDPDDAFAFVSQMGVTIGLLDGLDETTRDESLQRLRGTLDDAMTNKGVVFASQSWLIEARRT